MSNPLVSRRRAALAFAAALLTCLLATPAASADTPVQRLEDGGLREIIVTRVGGLTAGERAELRADAGARHVRAMRLSDTEVVRVPAGRLVEALAELNASPDVVHAEPDVPVRALSADTHWAILWGLDSIDAPEAWTHSLGAGQTVAVVDTGSAFGHEDLAGQFATNPGESGAGREANGVDDDGNGLVDDYRGWDFVDDDNDPSDGHYHGTHVAATIAAAKDNMLGIAGVAPSAKVLTLRVLNDAGSGSFSDVAEAFDLAGALGIRVVNASLGGLATLGASQTIQNAVQAHPQTLYVIAAGNDGTNNDVDPFFPCALPDANVICVGATDASDARAGFSNYGSVSVDLSAPGVSIASAKWSPGCPTTCYAYANGTSMAAPHVAGVLALMRAANPALTAAELRSRLLATVDVRAGLAGTTATGGRLNANAAVIAASAGPDPDPGPGVDPVDPTVDVDPTGDETTPPAEPPLLGKPSLTRSTVTRSKRATLRFTLARAATVRLTVRRASATGHKAAATVRIAAAAGANRYVLKTTVGRPALRPGRYRLTVVARDGQVESRAYTLRFTVR
jgi:thermitase